MTGTGTKRAADGIDTALLVLFLLGIYVGYSPNLAAGVPLPCAPAAVAAVLLLLRNRRFIVQNHLFAVFAVIGLYLLSVLCVPDTEFLGERFKGFLQLSYSLVLAYAGFLTCTLYDRDRLARIFLAFAGAILVGCLLETYTEFRAVSDAVRAVLFDQYLYVAAERDEALYGGVRPNLFTSEPSNVAFGFTVMAFFWYVVTTANGKTLIYAALLGAGMVALRSPTIVLGFALIGPYQIFVAGRSAWGRTRGLDHAIILFVFLALIGVAAMILAGGHLFAERLSEIGDDNDPSFFYRVLGPAAVAWDTAVRLPFAGAGLTGEEFIADRVFQIYVTSPGFSPQWDINRISEVLTNYFWLHWIYLGPLGGAIVLWALGRMLRSLNVPSVAFCICVWAIMGQASGAYVSPRPWMVLMISGALAMIHFRQPGKLPRRPARRRAEGRQPAYSPATGRSTA